jgi:hypothetical protein
MLQKGVLLLVLVLALTCRTGRAGKFWHITDLHLDRDYVVGGNAKDMCHRYLWAFCPCSCQIEHNPGVFFSHAFFIFLSVRIRPCWVKVEPASATIFGEKKNLFTYLKRNLYYKTLLSFFIW